MRKLFATEDNTEEKPGELLIDKLTSLKTKEKEGLPLTAELIKQRNQLKQEINKEISENNPEDNSTEGGKDDQNNGEGSQNSDDQNQPPEGQTENKDNKASQADETGGSEAEDIDQLTSLVGSANASTENYRQPRLVYKTFREHVLGILSKHGAYRVALESMNLEDQAQPATEQPVAYVKDEVIGSLNSLIGLAGKYVTNNQQAVEGASEGVKTLMEQLTTYRGYHEKEQFSFTAKLVSKDDVLTSLSVKGKSDLKETSAILLKYMDVTSPLVEKLLTNDLSQLPSVLKTSQFSDEKGVLEYKEMLPGFFTIQAGYEPYLNYMKTKYEDYQIFRLKVLKTQDLYDLSHISLSDDNTFFTVLDRADKILLNVGLCIDNLKTINDSYGHLTVKLKALVYEIEKGEKERLSEIGLDEQLKDFIKYKLAAELYAINIKLGIEYLTSLVSAFTELVELKN